jgi:zinc protease
MHYTVSFCHNPNPLPTSRFPSGAIFKSMTHVLAFLRGRRSRLVSGRIAIALALIVPGSVSAQGAALRVASADTSSRLPIDPNVISGHLPNGLRYFIRKNARPDKRAELRLAVDAGSVLEGDDQRGLAHFVEHMAFNGTKRFEKQELVNFIERIGMRFGAHLNAYTSFDETVYMLRVPTDKPAVVDTAFQILEDWAQAVAFDSTEIEKERGVVVEEWRAGLGAEERIREKHFPVLFRDSRYATRLPIGDRRTLETFKQESLKRFYRDWYRPDLMAVIAVGDFDPKTIEAQIKRRFGALPTRPRTPVRSSFPVPDHDSTYVAIATDREATQSAVTVIYKQPVREVRTLGAYRRGLVEALYNSMLNDRLDELTQKPDAPYIGAGSSQGRFIRSKEVYVLGAAVKDDAMARGLEAVLTEAERVDQHGFTATELERAKQDLLRGYEQAYAEREKSESDGYADEYVRHFLEGEPIPGITNEYELAKRFVPAIQLAEVNRLAREWITDRSRVILASAPEKEGVQVATESELRAVLGRVRGKGVVAYADSVGAGALVATEPAPGRIVAERIDTTLATREWTLSNGVRVILKPTDFKADELLISAFSPGGTSLVPDSAYWPVAFASQLVALGGVGNFDAIALQKKLAGKAAGASPYISGEYEGFTGSASPKDMETLFQLIYLYFTAPRRDSSAVLAFKQNAKAALAHRSADPDAAFSDTLGAIMSQHHPRVRPITAEVVEELDLDRSLALYRDRFADASDFTFVIVGTFRPDSLKPLVERYIASLPNRGRREAWRDVGIRPPTSVVTRDVRKGIEPKAQTQIVFTGDFEYNANNRLAIRAVADVLEIKLRERLREALGGTYGADVYASPSRIPRPAYSFTVSFGSDPTRVDELTRAVFAEIDSVKSHGPSAADLAKVKEMYLRQHETDLKQNRWWLGQLGAYAQTGEAPQTLLAYPARVRSLTADQVREAARKWLDTGRYVKVSLLPEK